MRPITGIEDAERVGHAAWRCVGLLGRRKDLDQSDERTQLRDGQAGARLDSRAHPSESDRRFLQGWIVASVRQGVPNRSERTSDADV